MSHASPDAPVPDPPAPADLPSPPDWDDAPVSGKAETTPDDGYEPL